MIIGKHMLLSHVDPSDAITKVAGLGGHFGQQSRPASAPTRSAAIGSVSPTGTCLTGANAAELHEHITDGTMESQGPTIGESRRGSAILRQCPFPNKEHGNFALAGILSKVYKKWLFMKTSTHQPSSLLVFATPND